MGYLCSRLIGQAYEGYSPLVPSQGIGRFDSSILRFAFFAEIWYDRYMTNEEISNLLDKESYRIWDTTKVIKNQDYHDGLVKGLKMAARLVAKL